MKFFAILILSALATLASAQPNSIGFIAYRTSGNAVANQSPALGGCVEVTHDLINGNLPILGHVEACYDNGAKSYVGNGHNIGIKGQANAYVTHSGQLRPYLIGGVGWSQQSNSQYSKAIINPFVGFGLNYRNRLFYEATYLLPESQTANHVSALRTGAYFIQPLSAHWGVKFGASVTSQKFTQPNGAAAGTYRVSSYSMFAGVLRMNNPKAEPIEKPVLKARPRYADLPKMAMTFTNDFGNYSLMLPSELQQW